MHSSSSGCVCPSSNSALHKVFEMCYLPCSEVSPLHSVRLRLETDLTRDKTSNNTEMSLKLKWSSDGISPTCIDLRVKVTEPATSK